MNQICYQGVTYHLITEEEGSPCFRCAGTRVSALLLTERIWQFAALLTDYTDVIALLNVRYWEGDTKGVRHDYFIIKQHGTLTFDTFATPIPAHQRLTLTAQWQVHHDTISRLRKLQLLVGA